MVTEGMNVRAIGVGSMDCIDITSDSKFFGHEAVDINVGIAQSVSEASHTVYLEQAKEMVRHLRFDPNFPP